MRIPGYCFVQIIPAVTDNQNSLHESGTVVQKWHVVFVTSSNNLFPMLIQDCLTFNFVEPAVYCQQEQFYHLQLHVLQLHHRRPPFLHVAPEHRLDHRRPRCQDTAVRHPQHSTSRPHELLLEAFSLLRQGKGCCFLPCNLSHNQQQRANCRIIGSDVTLIIKLAFHDHIHQH
jgi:hypothetical protein